MTEWEGSRVVDASDGFPVGCFVFRVWSKLMRGRSPVGWRAAMIAATAIVHDLTIVTRNTKDFVDFGVRLFDPFAPR